VEDIDEPGGGKRVRLKEPNGYQVEVVYGIETLKPIPVERQALNSGLDPLKRAGELYRLPKGPSRVKRIGHGVMASPRITETVQWFRDTLGFVCSDDVYAGSKDNIIGSFNRSDRGETYVDHHVFVCIKNECARRAVFGGGLDGPLRDLRSPKLACHPRLCPGSSAT